MKKLYLIGGTIGIGKTTTCQVLKTKLDKWKFDFDKWTEHIFNPFFESNYKVIKREFKIVFTDDL